MSTLARHAAAPDLRDELGAALRGDIVIVGVGNRLMGDDAAGPVVVDALSAYPAIHTIDAGTAPENFAEKVVRLRPDAVLIVDALDHDGPAGSWQLIGREEIGPGGLSSHALSLSMFAEYVYRRCGADVHLLGVKPQSVGIGAAMSGPVAAAAQAAASIISDVCAGRASQR